MYVENKFLFLSIPRCATVSFETSLVEQGFKIKYYPNILTEKRVNMGLLPINHGHQAISVLEKNLLINESVKDETTEIDRISIYREPLERFISGWKYVLKNIKIVDEKSYTILKTIDNKEFIDRFSSIITSPLDITKPPTFDKLLGPILSYDLLTDKKFTNSRNVFESTLTPPSRWHENNVKIRFFDIKNLSELENYVREKTNKDFVLKKINDTFDIETSLIIDEDLKKFYFSKIEIPQKIIKSVI